MALLTSELRRIRQELGYNVLDAGAEPYIGTASVFEQVIATYMQAGASTTSSTAVTAATTATAVTLTLASATGFSALARVVVDVDDRQESATVQTVSGNTITVLLSLAHSNTYPVTVEAGEALVREHLRRLQAIANELGDGAIVAAGIKRADDIEFFPAGTGSTKGRIQQLAELREYWRDELASTLGVVNLRKLRRGASGVALY